MILSILNNVRLVLVYLFAKYNKNYGLIKKYIMYPELKKGPNTNKFEIPKKNRRSALPPVPLHSKIAYYLAEY